jgi:hypothetical protein
MRLAQSAGRLDAVYVGHLDVGNHHLGPILIALLQQLDAVLGQADDPVPKAIQGVLRELTHFGFVVGDDDAKGLTHTIVPRERTDARARRLRKSPALAFSKKAGRAIIASEKAIRTP